MLGDALSFPRNHDDWVKTHVIGGILIVLSFLFVPILPVLGYTVEVLRRSARGERTPPTFDDWGDLFVDGVKLLVVQFVYTVPILVLYFVVVLGGAFAVGMGDSAGGSGGAGAGNVVLLLLLGLVMLLSLLVAYVVPAATANFALYDDLGKAFALREVLGVAFTADYLVAILVAVLVSIPLALVAGLLSIILVGIPLLFYLQVVVYYLYGQGYARGRAKRGNPVRSPPVG